jgi:hypothetical protein
MHEVPLMVIDRESASGQNRTHTQSAIGKVLGDVANIINQTAAALIDQPIRCCAISSFCGAQCVCALQSRFPRFTTTWQ